MSCGVITLPMRALMERERERETERARERVGRSEFQ
jgi:hypothetical protein